MIHLGANIYYWDGHDQLLARGLRHWIREARQNRLIRRMWYCPFDARGPHIFALVSTEAAKLGSVQEFFRHRIDDFLRTWPSRPQPGAQEVAERHRQCRGKVMNSADRRRGMAANNSFSLFPHGDDEYPFAIFRCTSDPERLWLYLDQVASYALEHAGSGSGAAALRWLAAVDRSLQKEKENVPAADYWRFHAESLLLGLKGSLQEPGVAVERLNRAISAGNKQLFDQLWNGIEPAIPAVADDLVQLVMRDPKRQIAQRFQVLREINHTTLLQLGQMVRCHIPMVLYAWQRNL
jgi:hypothetical protein